MDRKSKNKQIREKRRKKTKQRKIQDAMYGKDLILKLQKTFRAYSVLPEVLESLIISYCTWREWETIAYTSWNTVNRRDPDAIFFGHQQDIYLCLPDNFSIIKYNLIGEIVEEIKSISPRGIDIDTTKSVLYIVNETHVLLLSLQSKTVILSWRLPPGNNFHYIKVDGNILYLTADWFNQSFCLTVRVKN